MTTPLPRTTSDTARLMIDAPSFAVGWQERIVIPNPVPGQSWSYTVDGRYYERVIAVAFTLVTSAVVANRFAQLYLKDYNGAVITSVPCGGVVVAGSTLNVYLTHDAPSYSGGVSGGTFGKIPDVLAAPGWQWSAQVFGEDAGDQVSAVVLLVQRFPNDAAVISAAG